MIDATLDHDNAAAERERSAFNVAFYELGLRWHWDSETYRALAEQTDEGALLRSYLEAEQSHILRAYDAKFLTDAILVAKRRCRGALAHCPPCALPRFNWADARWGETGF